MEDFDYETIKPGYYDEIYARNWGLRSFWHRQLFAQIRSFIVPNEAMTILDVGCAAGSFLGNLDLKFHAATGIDISMPQVSYAQAKYAHKKINFMTGDIRLLEINNMKFDVIIMSEVIEHLSYPETLQVLQKLKNLLKDGGRLIMTTPNYGSFWPQVEYFLNRFTPVSYEHQHINKIDRRKMAHLMAESGWSSFEMRTFFVVGPFLAKISTRLARWICRLESKILKNQGLIIIVSASA